MFEGAFIVAALVSELKCNEEMADRRAFYGPDLTPSQDESRRKVRRPRFMRRGTNLT